MKRIRPSRNPHQFPRHTAKTVECRKRDLVFRITDWWDDKDEPAYDVETYIGGVYDFNESKSFTRNEGITAEGLKTGGYTKSQAKAAAIEFVSQQTAKLL